MRVLMILIPDLTNDNRPILEIERIVEPYYALRDAAVEVVLVSPDGGSPWGRQASKDPERPSPNLLRFGLDHAAREALADTLSLDQIFFDDFDAAFCIGALGAVWSGEPAASLLANFLAAGKPVAIVPNKINLSPHGTGEGLLITGDGAHAPAQAAHALIGALRS